ncbi:10394_t:CDS:2 [Entrophospora sp. SA101]|nr:10394_t:CDS:2 [Entrophospora sp. SA101]
MISSLLWVRKGAAAEKPEKYELDDKEFERISKFPEFKPELMKKIDNESKAIIKEEDEEMKDIKMMEEEGLSIFGNVKGLAYYTSNKEDPYITLNDDDEDEDSGDIRILPTDNLLVVAKTEDELSHLEICVYEELEDNFYVHHDIMMPSFPLCLEWLDFRLGSKDGSGSTVDAPGNYIAVGTFEPEIEIWDLDTIDSVYPNAILADTTMKLWDLQSLKCVHSFNHHKDKVQQVEWHPIESTILLSASFDKTVSAFDSRSPDVISYWSLHDTEPECIKWDPLSPNNFYVSTESGSVLNYDIRNHSNSIGDAQQQPVFTLHAHDGSCTSIDLNYQIKGLLVTGSIDKQVKIWDCSDNKPVLITSKNFGVGKIFSTKFCPDSAYQLAMGGSEAPISARYGNESQAVGNNLLSFPSLQW